jgi:hypothetical protein
MNTATEGTKRPALTFVSAWVPTELAEALEAQAAAQFHSKSAELRQALAKHLGGEKAAA